jgi:hypothetical protein
MKKRIYADGVEAISFSEGMVRIDLFNILPGKNNEPGKASEREVTDELIMTSQGFLRSYSAMEKLVKQLMDAGVVQRNDAAENKPAAPENSSPNFK